VILLIIANILSSIQRAEALAALGYYFTSSSYQSLQNEINVLTEVSFDYYNVGKTGTVTGSAPAEGRQLASSNTNIKQFMVASNYAGRAFNRKVGHAILSNPTHRATAVSNLVSLAESGSYSGVNIDFENISSGDRSSYSVFIEELAQALHAKSLLLVISVPPKQADDPTDSWSGAYDYATLGQYVDIMQVMTYDENGPWNPRDPGPVAALDWVEACINYTMTVVPKSKISVGVPAYGYYWNMKTGKGGSFNYANTAKFLAGKEIYWDAASSSPFSKWTEPNGDKMVAWFENAESISLKGQFVKSIGVHGVSVWALGDDNTAFWQALLG